MFVVTAFAVFPKSTDLTFKATASAVYQLPVSAEALTTNAGTRRFEAPWPRSVLLLGLRLSF